MIKKNEGRVSEERMERIKQAESFLTRHLPELTSNATSAEDKKAVRAVADGLESLKDLIKRRMVELIEGSALRLGEIEQEFTKLHHTIQVTSRNLEESLVKMEAAIEFKLLMAQEPEKIEKIKAAGERLFSMRMAATRLVLAGSDSIIEKDKGLVSAANSQAIKESVVFLEEGFKVVSAFAEDDEDKASMDQMGQEMKKLIQLVQSDLPGKIQSAPLEKNRIIKDFDDIIQDMGSQAGYVAEQLDRIIVSSRKEAENAGLRLQAAQESSLWQGVGVFLIAVLVIIPVFFFFARGILRPMSRGVRFAGALGRGDLSQRLESTSRDEIGQLAEALNKAADSLEGKAHLAENIADGDLRVTVDLASEQDSLGKSLQEMTDKLNQVFSMVTETAFQVSDSSTQVADSSQSLSQGATEQAASLEEISSSMTELGSQTRVNAENATQASQLAREAKGAAQKGNDQMSEMITAMKEINDSSREIAKIIKAIDDIAFQTNLLALNAAVEAARAGQHGKGFAVVAQEVRNLAGRSAKAAAETAELIENSVKRVQAGSDIVNRTAAALGEIVGGASKVTDLVAEIAAASNEQAEGIAQINQGLNQVDQVTQRNTASAEETASAAEMLSSQADQLRKLTTSFRLRGDNGDAEAWLASEHEEPEQLEMDESEDAPKEEWGRPLKAAGLVAWDEESEKG
ncbi:MAG: HAMP domain-containing protein [Proteobacteria bacterium]|nr:HAMP domain-containing protein [Pseudomonadota bacterium]